MAIFRPGLRKKGSSNSREAVVTLSVTAMADMFTVLVVFLLQNMVVTGEVLDLYKDVHLPQARETKELKPANVVVIADKYLMLNNELISGYEEFKKSSGVWLLEPLKKGLEEVIKKEKEKNVLLRKERAKKNLEVSGKELDEDETPEEFRLTIQADQDTEFIILKKVMYTATQAGVREINFAVIPKRKERP